MDKLTMIEKVVATMDAKEVRTLIVVCNDRLAALGEPVHQNKPAPTKGRRGSRRPFYCKEIPTLVDDSIKTFKDLNTDWVNDVVKFGKPCILTTKKDGKPTYMIVQAKAGNVLTLPNGCTVDDVECLDVGETVHSCISTFKQRAA